MTFDFVKFFTPWYLFAVRPSPLSHEFLICWLVWAGILLGAGIVIRVWIAYAGLLPAWRQWWRQLASILTNSSIAGLVLLFFRYQNVPFLSTRVLIVVWFAGTLYFVIRMLMKRKEVAARAASQAEERRLRKYLPH